MYYRYLSKSKGRELECASPPDRAFLTPGKRATHNHPRTTPMEETPFSALNSICNDSEEVIRIQASNDGCHKKEGR